MSQIFVEPLAKSVSSTSSLLYHVWRFKAALEILFEEGAISVSCHGKTSSFKFQVPSFEGKMPHIPGISQRYLVS